MSSVGGRVAAMCVHVLVGEDQDVVDLRVVTEAVVDEESLARRRARGLGSVAFNSPIFVMLSLPMITSYSGTPCCSPSTCRLLLTSAKCRIRHEHVDRVLVDAVQRVVEGSTGGYDVLDGGDAGDGEVGEGGGWGAAYYFFRGGEKGLLG